MTMRCGAKAFVRYAVSGAAIRGTAGEAAYSFYVLRRKGGGSAILDAFVAWLFAQTRA